MNHCSLFWMFRAFNVKFNIVNSVKICFLSQCWVCGWFRFSGQITVNGQTIPGLNFSNTPTSTPSLASRALSMPPAGDTSEYCANYTKLLYLLEWGLCKIMIFELGRMRLKWVTWLVSFRDCMSFQKPLNTMSKCKQTFMQSGTVGQAFCCMEAFAVSWWKLVIRHF
jgi:hypothetical protein